MDVKTNGRATRSSVNLLWTGNSPVTLPKSSFDRPARVLQPGINPNLPIEVLHELGAYPEWIVNIAEGRLKAVCVEHTFLEGDYHCLNCGENRDSAATAAVPMVASLSKEVHNASE